MLDQDNNIYLISLSILITNLLSNIWILQGEVICQSLLGVQGLMLKGIIIIIIITLFMCQL